MKGNTPKKGSSQWKKNETIINNNPVLKKARDKSQGIEKPDHRYNGGWHGGKGSTPRTNTSSQEWKDAYDQIDWSKGKEKRNYRVKINGRYVDDQD